MERREVTVKKLQLGARRSSDHMDSSPTKFVDHTNSPSSVRKLGGSSVNVLPRSPASPRRTPVPISSKPTKSETDLGIIQTPPERARKQTLKLSKPSSHHLHHHQRPTESPTTQLKNITSVPRFYGGSSFPFPSPSHSTPPPSSSASSPSPTPSPSPSLPRSTSPPPPSASPPPPSASPPPPSASPPPSSLPPSSPPSSSPPPSSCSLPSPENVNQRLDPPLKGEEKTPLGSSSSSLFEEEKGLHCARSVPHLKKDKGFRVLKKPGGTTTPRSTGPNIPQWRGPFGNPLAASQEMMSDESDECFTQTDATFSTASEMSYLANSVTSSRHSPIPSSPTLASTRHPSPSFPRPSSPPLPGKRPRREYSPSKGDGSPRHKDPFSFLPINITHRTQGGASKRRTSVGTDHGLIESGLLWKVLFDLEGELREVRIAAENDYTDIKRKAREEKYATEELNEEDAVVEIEREIEFKKERDMVWELIFRRLQEHRRVVVPPSPPSNIPPPEDTKISTSALFTCPRKQTYLAPPAPIREGEREGEGEGEGEGRGQGLENHVDDSEQNGQEPVPLPPCEEVFGYIRGNNVVALNKLVVCFFFLPLLFSPFFLFDYKKKLFWPKILY